MQKSGMTLWEGIPSKAYTIERIIVDENLERRLEALGMNEGTPVSVITKKKSGSMVVKIRGSRLALGKYITSNIEVKEVSNE